MELWWWWHNSITPLKIIEFCLYNKCLYYFEWMLCEQCIQAGNKTKTPHWVWPPLGNLQPTLPLRLHDRLDLLSVWRLRIWAILLVSPEHVEFFTLSLLSCSQQGFWNKRNHQAASWSWCPKSEMTGHNMASLAMGGGAKCPGNTSPESIWVAHTLISVQLLSPSS